MKTLIFCFDGTWASRDEHTNIAKMWTALNRGEQVPIYFAGPGNDEDNGWIGEKLGGAFGVGMWAIRDQAMEVLDAIWQPGDKIVVTGFSRGAAIARMFCVKSPHDVDLLMCYDTVFARLPFGGSQQGTLFSDLHVSPRVAEAYHAVALDEDREAFEPNLMNRRTGIHEMWFPGGHSDIGGGNQYTGLSDLALGWMLNACAERGIVSDVNLNPDPLSVMTVSDAMLRHDKRHVGVMVNDEWADEVPQYHPSFLQRMDADPVYRQKWAGS